jgi:hypothetical protein
VLYFRFIFHGRIYFNLQLDYLNVMLDAILIIKLLEVCLSSPLFSTALIEIFYAEVNVILALSSGFRTQSLLF